MMTVKCKQCEKELHIPDGWEGAWYCPECGSRNTVQEESR